MRSVNLVLTHRLPLASLTELPELVCRALKSIFSFGKRDTDDD